MIVYTTDRANVQNFLERLLEDTSLQTVLELLAEACFTQSNQTDLVKLMMRWDKAGVAINKLALTLPASL